MTRLCGWCAPDTKAIGTITAVCAHGHETTVDFCQRHLDIFVPMVRMPHPTDLHFVCTVCRAGGKNRAVMLTHYTPLSDQKEMT